MIIESLTMNHFRQFYGEQTIEFAQSNGQQIVTVIHGENGRGKTGIYRAMMLALFGDFKLDQDSKEAEIDLVNIKAVEEETKGGNGVHCFVCLRFSHRNEAYKIKRTYFAMKGADGRQKEQLLKISLVNKSTGESWSDEREVQSIIKGIVDERVKHYFFFDGERIEQLTRASTFQKKEVTLGIKNLLKIDQVLKSKDVLVKVLSNVEKELDNHSTGEYKIELKKMSKLKQHLDLLIVDGQKLEEVRSSIESRQTEIDDALHSYESMREDMAERDRLEVELNRIEQTIDRTFIQVNGLNKYLPLMLGEDLFHQQLENLSRELSGGREDGVSYSFVESILTDLRCLCGTEIEEDSAKYNQIKSFAKSVQRYEENQQLYSIQSDLKQIVAYIEGRDEQIQQSLSELEILLSEREQNQWRTEEINKQVSESNEIKIRQLNEEHKSLALQAVNINHQQQLNKETETEYIDKIDKLTLRLKDLQHKSGIHQQLLEKHKILTKSVNAITNVIKKFEADLISELETATKQNLHYLLDQSGQAIMKDIQIKEDYTIEVLNNYGQPFLANISQGQRQVLSLSFITALAQVAGGSHLLEMPLFMDTPFGRLSGQHQESLIKYLPKICSQWILLVTDKEFGSAEHSQFLETGTIGRFYELIAVEAGVTKIKEVKTSSKSTGVNLHG